MIVDSQSVPKHKTEDLGDKLVISIPSRKDWRLTLGFRILSLSWLMLWLAILLAFLTLLIATSYNLSPASDLILLMLIVGWVGIGILSMYLLARQIFEREEIQITSQFIKISKVVLGFKRSKEYPENQITRLRLTRSDYGPNEKINQGLVAFNYDPQATDQYITFATGIDDIEAKQIIAEIQQRFPQYKK